MDGFTAALLAASRRTAATPAVTASPAELVANGEPGAFILPGTEWTDLYEETTGASATTPASVGGPVGTIHDLVTDSYWTVAADADRLTLRQDGGGRRYLDIPSGRAPMRVLKPALVSHDHGVLLVAVVENTSPGQNWVNIKQDHVGGAFPDHDAVHLGWALGGTQGFAAREPTGWNNDHVVTDPSWAKPANSGRFRLAGWWEGAGTPNRARLDGGPVAVGSLDIAGGDYGFDAHLALGCSGNQTSTEPFRLWGLVVVRDYTAERLTLAESLVEDATDG